MACARIFPDQFRARGSGDAPASSAGCTCCIGWTSAGSVRRSAPPQSGQVASNRLIDVGPNKRGLRCGTAGRYGGTRPNSRAVPSLRRRFPGSTSGEWWIKIWLGRHADIARGGSDRRSSDGTARRMLLVQQRRQFALVGSDMKDDEHTALEVCHQRGSKLTAMPPRRPQKFQLQ